MSDPKLIQNRYQLIEKLGQGGMGVVYKALDRLTGEQVALKQLRVSAQALDFASKAETDDTEKLRLGLASEFSILATLRHPHILSVLDFGFDESKRPYYTMTLLDGAMNFKNYALTQPEDTRYDLLLQVLQALHYLHRRGVLHRDLKPDNVLVTADGQVKVMDFGLAREETEVSQSSDSGKLFGTLHYMAPEVMHGQMASVAYDLYALGVMAYEVLFEKYPYADDNVAQLILQVLSQPVDCSALPPKLAVWLEGLLAKDPAKRPASAYDAMLDLYTARDMEVPPEDRTIRESFLQASTFVGREAELQQLAQALDTLDIENSFFLIGGESGVGKSRLVDELRIQALVKGVTVLRGQAVEGGGLPFQVWRNIVRRLLLMVDVDDLQASVLRGLVPDVSELLGRDIPEVPELTGPAHQKRIVFAIVDLLRKLPRPILILLEDLHWAVESLEPLKQILLVQTQLPHLMIVASYRDDEVPTLPDPLANMTSIKLERLSEPLVGELSAAMLGDAGADGEVIHRLYQESEGNVFFVVETVRALAEVSGGLNQVNRSTLVDGILTGGMLQILLRRLNAVSPHFSDIQKLAAVIGRKIDAKLLAHVHAQERVNKWLMDAAEHAVLDVQDNTWLFAHDKFREAVLAELPDTEKPAWHQRAAEAIEAVYPADAAYNEALFTHWREAGDLSKEIQYLELVVENLLKTTANHQQIQHLVTQGLSRLPDDDERGIALTNLLARFYLRVMGDAQQAQIYGEKSKTLSQRFGDQNGLAESLRHLGVAAVYQGDYAAARDLFQQSLDIAQSIGDQRLIGYSLNSLGTTAMMQGDYAVAQDYYQQSIVIAEAMGDLYLVAGYLSNLGVMAAQHGEYEVAQDRYQRSLNISSEIGDKLHTAIVLANMGGLALQQSEYARALDSYQQSLAIQKELGDQRGIAESLSMLGWVALLQGQPTAIDQFVESLRVAVEIRTPAFQLHSVIGLAGVLQKKGATERVATFLGLAKEHPSLLPETRPHIDAMMPQLEAAMAPQELQAALERGKTLDLDTVVHELLAEFSPSEEV